MKFLTNGLIAIGVFWGISAVLIVEFYSDFFGSSLDPSETLLGTVLGAAIALSGTLVTIYASQEMEQSKANEKDEITIHSVLAKMLDLNDNMLKNKTHFRQNDFQSRVFFGPEQNPRYFSKPLESRARPIDFSTEERAVLLRKGKANFFNALSDMQGVSDSLTFLLEKHKTVYYDLQSEWHTRETAREGYWISGEINVNSPKLMAMMDVDGALRSFLERSGPEVESFLLQLIELSNENSSSKIAYSVMEVAPSAQNSHRQEY